MDILLLTFQNQNLLGKIKGMFISALAIQMDDYFFQEHFITSHTNFVT